MYTIQSTKLTSHRALFLLENGSIEIQKQLLLSTQECQLQLTRLCVQILILFPMVTTWFTDKSICSHSSRGRVNLHAGQLTNWTIQHFHQLSSWGTAEAEPTYLCLAGRIYMAISNAVLAVPDSTRLSSPQIDQSLSCLQIFDSKLDYFNCQVTHLNPTSKHTLSR